MVAEARRSMLLQSLDDRLARPGHRPRRDRVQLARRRPARRAQSEDVSTMTVLEVEGYTPRLRDARRRTFRALDDIDLAVARGEVSGLVGESGSGKTSLAWAVMRYLPATARRTGGAIQPRRRGPADEEPRRNRPHPRPAHRHGVPGPEHLAQPDPDPGRAGRRGAGPPPGAVAQGRPGREGEAMLHRVGLKQPAAMMRRYPHEASAARSSASSSQPPSPAEPECILFDEPTTALDVITARQILDLFAELQAETGVASLYISHDLALVSRVRRPGRRHPSRPASSRGSVAEVFAHPQRRLHAQLVAAVPRPDRRLVRRPRRRRRRRRCSEVEQDDCALRPHVLLSAAAPAASRSDVVGAREVSLDVQPGEILGIVGESGSGKSTLAKRARPASTRSRARSASRAGASRMPRDMDRDYRRDVQIVFQHPDSSLNPRQRVREILSRPLRLYGKARPIADARRATPRAGAPARRLRRALPAPALRRREAARRDRPRLRVRAEAGDLRRDHVVARRLGPGPVDRAAGRLQRRYGTAYLFITHDLNLVRQIAHRIAVMYRGELVELSDIDDSPQARRHPYTRPSSNAVPAPAG